MKEIVVLSGKGGTGKTSITASLAVLGGADLVLADCDVDAADMHLLMDPKPILEEDFYSGKIAEIKNEGCTLCEKCIDVCHFDAIHFVGDGYRAHPFRYPRFKQGIQTCTSVQNTCSLHYQQSRF